MRSAVERAIVQAHRAQFRTNGETVTYVAGTQETQLNVVRGQSEWEAANDFNAAIVNTRTVDWLIVRSDLHFDGEPFDPQPGHLVKVEFENTCETYEVRPPADGQQCWRPADQYLSMIRVHSVRSEVT